MKQVLVAAMFMLAGCSGGTDGNTAADGIAATAENGAAATTTAAAVAPAGNCPSGRQVAFACTFPTGGGVQVCGGGMAASYKSTGGPSGALELEKQAGKGLVSASKIGSEGQSGQQSTLRFSDDGAEHIVVSSVRGPVMDQVVKNKVVVMRDGKIAAQADCAADGLTELNLNVFESQLPQGKDPAYDDQWF
jgi:hypothetical protein